jgi:tRNA pseudouridine38-40 synthase
MLRLDPAPRTTVAGRTDAGVHARHQVAHVDLPAAVREGLVRRRTAPGERGAGGAVVDRRSLPDGPGVVEERTEPRVEALEGRLARRLRALLPEDVQMHRMAPAPSGFDARFGALWRRYAYRIADQPAARDPLNRLNVWWASGELDTAAMQRAATGLLGEHDFAAFCRPREGASTVRTVQEITVDRSPEGLIEVWVQADAFCHNQVRAMVGALVAVGAGRRPPSWPAQALAARVREAAATVLPARGLTLEWVEYPPDDLLATQAAVARVFRGQAVTNRLLGTA